MTGSLTKDARYVEVTDEYVHTAGPESNSFSESFSTSKAKYFPGP